MVSTDDSLELPRIKTAMDPRRKWQIAIGVSALITAVFVVLSYGQAVWAGNQVDLGNDPTATNLRIGWAVGLIITAQLMGTVLVGLSCVLLTRDAPATHDLGWRSFSALAR